MIDPSRAFIAAYSVAIYAAIKANGVPEEKIDAVMRKLDSWPMPNSPQMVAQMMAIACSEVLNGDDGEVPGLR